MRRRTEHDFTLGVLVAATVLLLTCAFLVPRHGELSALGDAVVRAALLIAVTGLGLGAVRRSWAIGGGAIAGVLLGLALAWSALILYVGLLMG